MPYEPDPDYFDGLSFKSFFHALLICAAIFAVILFAIWLWASTPCMEWLVNPETGQMVWSECNV